MVARSNNGVPRRENTFYDLNHKNSQYRHCSTLAKNHSANQSTMKSEDEDKENHLIEAIVFTTDFLSCTKEPRKGSQWICGSSGSFKTSDSGESSSYDNDDGWFGVKRRQIISYKNAEDLTRKVDDLFHRKRSPLSAGAAAEIRDDLSEEDDCIYQDESDRHFFSNLQRRIDDATSTCPSTNPSLSQEELSHWYSSSWSSFTYYGGSKENHCTSRTTRSTDSNSTHFSPMRSLQTQTARFDTSPRNQIHGNRSHKLNDCGAFDSRSSSSMPDFLKGVEFKKNSHHHRVISLPPSLPSWEEDPVKCQTQTRNSKMKKGTMDSRGLLRRETTFTDSGRRRLGRRTRHFWKKAKNLFRR